MNQNDKMNFLAQSIQSARKVMEKVEGGAITAKNEYSKRPMTEDDIDRMLDSDGNDLISEAQMRTKSNSMRNLSTSKMPAAILKSFQENPIIDPTAPVGMESMMQEITKKVAPVKTEQITERVNLTQPQSSAPVMDTKLIEYIIKKTVEETLEQVSKKTAIDENFQIKIGDKTFGGKLTALKETKK
jgi:arsenate reductase-like glutaredoxin family protein